MEAGHKQMFIETMDQTTALGYMKTMWNLKGADGFTWILAILTAKTNSFTSAACEALIQVTGWFHSPL